MLDINYNFFNFRRPPSVYKLFFFSILKYIIYDNFHRNIFYYSVFVFHFLEFFVTVCNFTYHADSIYFFLTFFLS